MTDLNKERELEAQIESFKKEAMELWFVPNLADTYKNKDLFSCSIMDGEVFFMREQARQLWSFWNKAKAQAVPEHIVTLQRNGEVFKFDLLDLLRRSLKSSKVLKTRENWSHVSKMVGIGSTTSTLLCKEMNVDPDGTIFVESESGAEG
ncbi:hypothetical protein RMB13_07250 [Acinetobacter sp. V102_4]|uniref:hypothetical protein n=1 Tax=Acinetobacter sp. V102_4 TaxID=3072984 RepID=UPI00287BF274|nr:hypothetical protein [Acinetobacter sp. V102_4]MDS7929273.1 hypothetical protein [Acinetobacter sp. V102_4]